MSEKTVLRWVNMDYIQQNLLYTSWGTFNDNLLLLLVFASYNALDNRKMLTFQLSVLIMDSQKLL